MTRLLDRMITAGLVMREAWQGDGVGDHRKVGPDHSKDAWEFFGHVTQAEAAVMEKVFSRVLAAGKNLTRDNQD